MRRSVHGGRVPYRGRSPYRRRVFSSEAGDFDGFYRDARRSASRVNPWLGSACLEDPDIGIRTLNPSDYGWDGVAAGEDWVDGILRSNSAKFKQVQRKYDDEVKEHLLNYNNGHPEVADWWDEVTYIGYNDTHSDTASAREYLEDEEAQLRGGVPPAIFALYVIDLFNDAWERGEIGSSRTRVISKRISRFRKSRRVSSDMYKEDAWYRDFCKSLEEETPRYASMILEDGYLGVDELDALYRDYSPADAAKLCAEEFRDMVSKYGFPPDG